MGQCISHEDDPIDSTGVEYCNARFCDIVPPYAAAPLADQHDHDHMKRLSG